MKVFYFGAWTVAGHRVFMPSGMSPRPHMAGPWSPRDLDADGYTGAGARVTVTGGGFCPPDPDQPQGVWRLTSAPGWTAIGCWDRTCDSRRGSRSVFVAEGEHSEEIMKRIAAEHFPDVWARIIGSPRRSAGASGGR